jgi:hypothetical protein
MTRTFRFVNATDGPLSLPSELPGDSSVENCGGGPGCSNGRGMPIEGEGVPPGGRVWFSVEGSEVELDSFASDMEKAGFTPGWGPVIGE